MERRAELKHKLAFIVSVLMLLILAGRPVYAGIVEADPSGEAEVSYPETGEVVYEESADIIETDSENELS